MASHKEHMELVRCLCEARATVDQTTQDGTTPLLIASQEGHLEVAQFLRETNATMDQEKRLW